MRYGSILNAMQWNDITKIKSFKFVFMLPALHRFALSDSNITDQRTGYKIPKPDAIIDHNNKKKIGGMDLMD